MITTTTPTAVFLSFSFLHFLFSLCLIFLISSFLLFLLPPLCVSTSSVLPGSYCLSSSLSSSCLPCVKDFIEGMDTAENQLDGTPVSKEELLRKHAHFLESIRSAKVGVVIWSGACSCHVMAMWVSCDCEVMWWSCVSHMTLMYADVYCALIMLQAHTCLTSMGWWQVSHDHVSQECHMTMWLTYVCNSHSPPPLPPPPPIPLTLPFPYRMSP